MWESALPDELPRAETSSFIISPTPSPVRRYRVPPSSPASTPTRSGKTSSVLTATLFQSSSALSPVPSSAESTCISMPPRRKQQTSVFQQNKLRVCQPCGNPCLNQNPFTKALRSIQTNYKRRASRLHAHPTIYEPQPPPQQHQPPSSPQSPQQLLIPSLLRRQPVGKMKVEKRKPASKKTKATSRKLGAVASVEVPSSSSSSSFVEPSSPSSADTYSPPPKPKSKTRRRAARPRKAKDRT